MNHPSFRTALFRFVDVFPATLDDADVARHLGEYFDDADAPRRSGLGLDAADHVPFGEHVAASVAAPLHRQDGRAVHRRPHTR